MHGKGGKSVVTTIPLTEKGQQKKTGGYPENSILPSGTERSGEVDYSDSSALCVKKWEGNIRNPCAVKFQSGIIGRDAPFYSV